MRPNPSSPFQQAPGALCALHPDRPASRTCERCGNFMCDECSEGRTQTFCPSCRQLTGVGAGFPFSRDNWDFGRLWSYTWEQFSREWLMLSLGILLMFVIQFGVGIVNNIIQAMMVSMAGQAYGTAIGTLFGLVLGQLVQGFVLMGLIRIFYDVLMGGRADLGRITSQLPKLGRFVVAQIILFLLQLVPVLSLYTILYVISAKVFAHTSVEDFQGVFNEGTVFLLMGGATILIVIPYLFVMLGFMFAVHELVWSEADGITALKNSWAIVSGNRWWLFLTYLVVFACAFVGTLMCCVGALPGTALGYMLLSALFLALRRGSGLPEPTATM